MLKSSVEVVAGLQSPIVNGAQGRIEHQIAVVEFVFEQSDSHVRALRRAEVNPAIDLSEDHLPIIGCELPLRRQGLFGRRGRFGRTLIWGTSTDHEHPSQRADDPQHGPVGQPLSRRQSGAAEAALQRCGLNFFGALCAALHRMAPCPSARMLQISITTASPFLATPWPWLISSRLCPLGATAKAGCWKPAITGACAFTGEPAGHARMPPGRRFAVTESNRGVSTPHSRVSREPAQIACLGQGSKSNV